MLRCLRNECLPRELLPFLSVAIRFPGLAPRVSTVLFASCSHFPPSSPQPRSERWRTLLTAACSRICWHATSLDMRSSLPRPSPSRPSFSASASSATWNCCSMEAFLLWKVCVLLVARLCLFVRLDSLNHDDGGAKDQKLPRHHMPQLHEWWEESK